MESRRSILSLASVTLFTLAGCSQTRQKTRTTDTLTEVTTSPSPRPETPTPADETIRWRFPTKGRMTLDNPPVIEEQLYVPSDDLYALSTEGELNWRSDIPGEFTHTPVLHGNRIYVVSGGPSGIDASIHGLSLDGQADWSFSLTEQSGEFEIIDATDEGVYIAGFDAPADSSSRSGQTTTVTTSGSYRPTARYVLALAPDGSERWRRKIGDVNGTWNGDRNRDTLYIHPPQSTTLYAIETDTGKVSWRFDQVKEGPAVNSKGVFVIDVEGSLRFLSHGGTEQWRFPMPSKRSENLVVKNGSVYLSDGISTLFAVDQRGKERWRYQSGGERLGRPTIDSGFVFMGSFAGNVYAVHDETGDEFWIYDSGGDRTVNPANGNDLLFVHELSENNLHAIDNVSGGGWRFSPGATPVFEGGTVYLGARNGTLYALKEG